MPVGVKTPTTVAPVNVELPTLPDDVIRVKNGRVEYYAEFVLWNGTPWRTLEIKLLEDGTYFCASSYPDGGSQTTGTLNDILAGFHHDVAARYRNILTEENPDEDTLRRLYGRRNRCKIEFL